MTDSTKENIVRLAVSNPIMTHEDMAKVEFEPYPKLARGKAKTFKEQQKHQERLNDFCVAARMALGILGMTKAQLVDMVRVFDEERGFDGVDEFYKSFQAQVVRGEALIEFLKSAEFRIAVAAHNFYAERSRPETTPQPPSKSKRRKSKAN
jgi:hypothetical protein